MDLIIHDNRKVALSCTFTESFSVKDKYKPNVMLRVTETILGYVWANAVVLDLNNIFAFELVDVEVTRVNNPKCKQGYTSVLAKGTLQCTCLLSEALYIVEALRHKSGKAHFTIKDSD